ncbi:hypothetical protein [Microcoleus sp. CAWBG640]
MLQNFKNLRIIPIALTTVWESQNSEVEAFFASVFQLLVVLRLGASE